MTENTCEEQEEVLMPGLHREICPRVGPQCRPEDREGTGTAGTGELNHEVVLRESDELPEAVVPDVALQREWGIPMAQGCSKCRYDCNSGNPVLQGSNGRVLTSGLGVNKVAEGFGAIGQKLQPHSVYVLLNDPRPEALKWACLIGAPAPGAQQHRERAYYSK
ncbi:hypothetical protein NDU88_012488 [Pleurodeles waltl]|uniref:Uncharacterized protein n=1 Tax=Pleurodeles waltl TaxID=8319 RepID=A0AAV7R629_PLEWA|nr:hypothetical protein NDU88_012488 [Pleurodeles waltl]